MLLLLLLFTIEYWTKAASKRFILCRQFENLDWLDDYIDEVEEGGSPSFDLLYRWGAFGRPGDIYDVAREEGAYMSLPALDAQIGALLQSTNKLLTVVHRAKLAKDSDSLLAGVSRTTAASEPKIIQSHCISCHPHCLSRWNKTS